MGERIKVAQRHDVKRDTGICVEAGGKKIALFNVDENYYAIDDTCTHRGGPLSEGEIAGTAVTCPWHGAQFDVRTGNVMSPPAPQSVRSYKVLVEGDDIKLEI